LLESLDLGKKLRRKDYEKELEQAHLELGRLQRQLKEKSIPLLVVVEGWEASGKGYVINELLRPLDPRGFVVHDQAEQDPKASLFPPFRRFWKMVPEKGKIVFLNRSWYRLLFEGKKPAWQDVSAMSAFLASAEAFEENLAAEGVGILKIFLHVSQKEQRQRLEKMAANPSTKWRISGEDMEENRKYAKISAAWETIIHRTDKPHAPWVCLPADDLQVGAMEALQALQVMFRGAAEKTGVEALGKGVSFLPAGLLKRVDLGKTIPEEDYKKELRILQDSLLGKQYDLYRKGKGLVVVFEGWDAAGKGGAIRRLTQGLDPRGYVVHPVSAPNEWERAHPYLWRFWVRLPRRGHIAIFDRSWYGRVLVERVEGFCSESQWRRAYGEINEMESEWVYSGYGLVKFWLQIDQEEQLRRFQEREQTEYKNWKITPEDWRNREKWSQYESATEEMLFRTSPSVAPWTIVEGNDKRYARVKVLKTVLSTVKTLLE